MSILGALDPRDIKEHQKLNPFTISSTIILHNNRPGTRSDDVMHRARTALDTQANGGINLISRSYVEQLVDVNEHKCTSCTKQTIKICSPLQPNNCVECNERIELTLLIPTIHKTNEFKVVQLQCVIVDLDERFADIIVSAETILKEGLLESRWIQTPVEARLEADASKRAATDTVRSSPVKGRNRKDSGSIAGVTKEEAVILGALREQSYISKEDVWGPQEPEQDGTDQIETISDLLEPDSGGTSASESGKTDLPKVHGSGPVPDGIRALLVRYSHLFSRTVRPDPAKIPKFKLAVDLAEWHVHGNSGAPRPQPPDRNEEIRRQIDLMLKLDIIEQRHDIGYYSQVLLTPKPNGKWRFCIDYRKLNAASLLNAGHPLPAIPDMLRRLGSRKFKWTAKMDLTSGYHQVEMDPGTRHLAAFITFLGVFVPKRLMFGVKAAPSYFQGHMAQTVLGPLWGTTCEVYIDDVITWGATDEEFLYNLELLFERYSQFGITLNPDKCEFGLKELEFVGHVINSEGISMSKERIQKVLQFPLPKTVKDIRSFIGLVNYFSDHVANCSLLLKPLMEMVVEQQRDPGNKSISAKKLSKKEVSWNEERTQAFEVVKSAVEYCTSLFFINDTDEIFLLTDASDYGIGAYLYQLVDGKERPIRFMSHTLAGAQLRWSTIEKECYAIFKAMEEFDYLLGGRRFHLLTDHRNLVFMNNPSGTKMLTDKLTRWKLAIQHMNFDIKHIDGVNNVVADLFSRLVFDNSRAMTGVEGRVPGVNPTDLTRHKHLVGAVCVQREVTVNTTDSHAQPLVEFEERELTELNEEETDGKGGVTTSQVKTTVGRPLLRIPRSSEDKPSTKGRTKKVRFTNETPQVISTNVTTPSEEEKFTWMVGVHNPFVGHHGFQRMRKRLKQQGHEWPQMSTDIRKFLDECPYCQKFDQRDNSDVIARPFVSSLAYSPMRRICIDTIGELPTSGVDGYQYVLVILDTFTRWIELYPLRSTGAVEAADALLDHFCRYGEPTELQSDRGNQFVNSLIGAITARRGIHQSLSLAYSKQENGRVERANKEVYRHLNALLFHHRIRQDWHKYLPFVRRIMNTTEHEVTGHSPAQLLFGETLSFDRFAVSGNPDTGGLDRPFLAPDQTEYLTQKEFTYWLQDRIRQQNTALSVARSLQRQHDEQHMQSVDPKSFTDFEDGTLVVVKPHDNPLSGRRPTTKFDPKWSGPYEIVSHTGNTYKLKDLIISDTVIERHIRDLKPFRFNPLYTDPIDVIARERQEMFVEEIMSHNGDPDDKTNMTFRVRWLGFGPDRETYEPWGNLKSNTLLHKYLIDKNLQNLIPTSFHQMYPDVFINTRSKGGKKRKKG